MPTYQPGGTVLSYLTDMTTGLVGTLDITIRAVTGGTALAGTLIAATTSGITEDAGGAPTSDSTYAAVSVLPADAAEGDYLPVWNPHDGGSAIYDFDDVFTVAGTASYDVTTDVGLVRLQIQDTDLTNPLFSDAEITIYLNQRGGNVLQAAADLCDVLAARFAQEFDFETDQQRFLRSQRSKAFAALSKTLRARAAGGITSYPTTRIDGYSDDISSEDVSVLNPRVGRVRAGYFDPDIPS